MPYTPKMGDIIMVPMAGAVGRLIQWGQWLADNVISNPFDEQWHHVMVVVGKTDPDHGVNVIEAMPGGALLTPLSHYQDTPQLVLRCPDGYRLAVADAALRCQGVPYSAADYFALAAHHLHLPAPGLKRYIESSRSMICSQLADHAALRGGWHLFDDDRWPGYVMPLDLARLAVRQEADRMRKGEQ
jgi:hypothetical protein